MGEERHRRQPQSPSDLVGASLFFAGLDVPGLLNHREFILMVGGRGLSLVVQYLTGALQYERRLICCTRPPSGLKWMD